MKSFQVLLRKLKKHNIGFDENCTFQKLTTFGCGGKVKLTVYPANVKQLVFVVRLLNKLHIRHCVLGHGSNVLAADADFDGVVVVTSQVRQLEVQGQLVVADCGVSTSKLCAELVRNGLTGGEFFGCLPATVGGAVVCNAGCFGQCVQYVVKYVTVLHNGRVKRLTNGQCLFSHRNSLFKNNNRFVLLQAEMQFAKTSPKQVQAILADMRRRKAETQPLGARSAGCVLYDSKIAVSKLIDQAGLKGFQIGGAQVSQKHAGFVINLDKATSRDIYLLIEYVKNTVTEKFGICPQTELCFINFDDG